VSLLLLLGQTADIGQVLAVCDRLRDFVLPPLGIRLSDVQGAPSVIKIDDKETLLREMKQK
jgi:cysteinyl-tRNA synthetase